MTEIGGDAVQRTPDDRQRRKISGVPVARHNLCSNRLGHQPQTRTDERLDLGSDVGVRPDRSGYFSDGDLGTCPLEPRLAACQFGVPVGNLEPEGDRFGMHAVAAPDHGRMAVGLGAALQHVEQGVEPGQDRVRRPAELDREGGIDHVVGSQSEVEKPSVLAHALGDRTDEGHYVVFDFGLDLAHAGDVDARALPQPRRHVGWNVTPFGQGLAGQQFDFEPRLELRLFGPDPAQFRARVPLDHGRSAIRSVGAAKEGCRTRPAGGVAIARTGR